MGTDIYTLVERQDDDGVWRVVKPPCRQNSLDWDLTQNYNLFGLLAGVGGDGPPLIEPRGVPDDASPEAVNYFSVESDPWLGRLSWWTVAELQAQAWPKEGA